MNIYEEIRSFIKDDIFKFTYTNQYLDVINYLKIIILEDDRIEIMIPDKILKIRGKNLTLKRIMNKELLIVGDIFELKMVNI